MSEEEVVVTEVVDSPKQEKKPKSKARKIIEWVFFGLFLLACGFILAGNIDGMVHKKQNYGQSIRFGVGSFIVLTNSMEPKIKTDSAIITYKEDCKKFGQRLEKGETIDVTFFNCYINIEIEPTTPDFQGLHPTDPTNLVMTHRLREVHVDETVPFGKGRYVFVASGINDQGELSKKGQYQIFTEKEYLGTVKMSNYVLGRVFNFMISVWGLLVLLLIPAIYLIVTSSIDIFKTVKAAEAEEEKAKAAAGSEKLAAISDEDRARLKKELLEEMMKAKREEKAKKDEKPE